MTRAANASEGPRAPAAPISKDLGSVRADPGKILWLWANLLIAAAGLPFCLSPRTGLIAALLTLPTLCAGHSVGLHRGVIHGTYRTGRIFRAALVYLFVLSGLGGPLSWVRLHYTRDYWQNRGDCPPYFAYAHGPGRDFFWNLHLRFDPEPGLGWARYRIPAALLQDRWLRFLEATWPLHNLALALLLLWLGGPEAVVVGFCARVAVSLLAHWYIGYASHVHGERPFAIEGAHESGTNNWLLGVISFGEGFHNNHHALPRSARMGMRPGDVDLGWWAVVLFERLGLFTDVRAWHRELGRCDPRATPLPQRSSSQGK